MSNQTSQFSKKYVYLKELPPTAEPLTQYGDKHIINTFIDKPTEKVYWFNGEVYKELKPILTYSIESDELEEIHLQSFIGAHHDVLFPHELKRLTELPKTAEPLEKYNNQVLNKVFIDKTTEKVYQFDGRTYNEQYAQVEQDGYAKYYVEDIDGRFAILHHHVLFGLN